MLPFVLSLMIICWLSLAVVALVAWPRLRSGSRLLTPAGEQVVGRFRGPLRPLTTRLAALTRSTVRPLWRAVAPPARAAGQRLDPFLAPLILAVQEGLAVQEAPGVPARRGVPAVPPVRPGVPAVPPGGPAEIPAHRHVRRAPRRSEAPPVAWGPAAASYRAGADEAEDTREDLIQPFRDRTGRTRGRPEARPAGRQPGPHARRLDVS